MGIAGAEVSGDEGADLGAEGLERGTGPGRHAGIAARPGAPGLRLGDDQAAAEAGRIAAQAGGQDGGLPVDAAALRDDQDVEIRLRLRRPGAAGRFGRGESNALPARRFGAGGPFGLPRGDALGLARLAFGDALGLAGLAFSLAAVRIRLSGHLRPQVSGQ